jgi:FlaA1/EpsC-like NDP-sugar epimerase
MHAVLGNAHHKYRVRDVMQAFNVQTVYHAAAYKHVPIVEQNLVEGFTTTCSAPGMRRRPRSRSASRPSC